MLKDDIRKRLTQALKNRETVRISVLRMLISDVRNREIADREKELGDEKVLDVIRKMVKRHKESIEQFRQGGRQDLVDKEEEEMKVVEEYLPEQMTEAELEKVISEVIKGTGAVTPTDMGKVMGSVMDRVKGRADGKLISRMVREKLGK
ncbi:MAG: GatB/YqeY domain-containing protein [Candidatus Omnitrophota bacterium]